jgi:hypothetical protein
MRFYFTDFFIATNFPQNVWTSSQFLRQPEKGLASALGDLSAFVKV